MGGKLINLYDKKRYLLRIFDIILHIHNTA